MYAKRNSITIALLLLLLAIGGFLWSNKETKTIDKLQTKNKELTAKLDGSLEIIEALSIVETKFQQLKQNWDQSAKKIIGADEPSFSLYYLTWIMSNYDIPLDFDFVLDNITEGGDMLKFSFTLSGIGSYHDVFRLIFYLTENPLLYRIDNFYLRQNEKNPESLDFKIQIQGFALTEKNNTAQEFMLESLQPIAESGLFHNAFQPLRSRNKPEPPPDYKIRDNMPKVNVQPKLDGLLDIERTSLQAVANGRIYLKDKNGKLVSMKVGDKVRMGNVHNINQNKSEVEFMLNKDGVQETVILGLGYKK